MSRPDEEELVDYDEAAEETFTAPTTAAAGAKGDGADKKGSYVGIHSTGFRSALCLCTRQLADFLRVGTFS